jgi:hypothetical protein
MKRLFLLMTLVLSFYSNLTYAFSELTCDYPDYQCPSGYQCRIEWKLGPYQCVKKPTSSQKSTIKSLHESNDQIYLLRTQIGANVFNDYLILNKNGLGSLTVSGVFSAVIFDYREQFRWGGSEIEFKIIARENNKETTITYDMFIANNVKRTIRGSLKDESGTIIGEILDGSQKYEFPSSTR